MKKLFQLIFGDFRNLVSVGLGILLAYAAGHWVHAAAGWTLVAVLLAAGFWQAA